MTIPKVNSDGNLTNTAGVWDVSFPQQLTGNTSISIKKDGYTLAFTLAGELRSSGELMTAAIGTAATEQLAVSQMQTATASIQQIDTATLGQAYTYSQAVPVKMYSQLRYNSIYANTDVIYDLQSDTVKESIVMDTYSSTLRGYRYTLNVGQLIPVLEEDGEITFYAPDKKTVVMVMPAPFLLDANNAFNEDVQVQLTGKGGTYTLTYLLPQQWLAAEERAWPVILDPVIKASRDKLGMQDRTVSENVTFSATKTTIDAGYSAERGKIRGFFKYTQLPPLTSSDVVVDATFKLHKVETNTVSKTVEVHKVAESWDHNSITWENQPDFVEDISDFVHVKNAGVYRWKVTEIVRSWYTEANNGLMIKMSNSVESGADGDYFRQFYSSDTGQYNRPALEVIFRNNNGIEGYWDYTSTAAGRAGTGYVNNFTGNLVWVRNDMGFNGSRMPVSIEHVYNANDAIVPADAEDEANNANDSGGNFFGLGIGWRTNYHQRVYQWACDDVTGDSDYYIWEDGDGTDHYFKKSSTSRYKDEDGLELTLKTNNAAPNIYSIENKKGFVSYFDAQGRLTKQVYKQETPSEINIFYVPDTFYEIDYITDGAGRKYDFTYTGGLLRSINYLGKGSTTLQSVTFGYVGDQLTTITDQDGKMISYAYNQDGILKSATDVDGYKVSYTYTRPDVISSSWKPPYLVSSITEADGNVSGGSLSFAYGYNETRMEDHNGNVQIMQFNDFGNMVGIMDDEGHAQYAQYTANSYEDTGKANQLNLHSRLQNTVANLINDSSFENETLWTASDSTSIRSISTTYSYSGAKSMHVRGRVYGSAFTIPKGETYTLSVYARADDTATIGINIGGTIVNQTEIPNGTDWTRYEVSYTNGGSADVLATPFLDAQDQQGAYFDCIQLEKAPTASRYNLVENGDFRHTGSDGFWTKNDDCTDSDTYVTPVDFESAAPQLDGTYFAITGNRTQTKNIQQTVKVNGDEGDSFVLAGWVAGYAVPQNAYDSNNRMFALRARFKYTDGKYSNYFYANFQPTIHGWQYSATPMVAKKDYTEITVMVVYHYNVNTIYLDGIQLFKEEFGTSYAYDTETGDVVSVVDLQKKNTTYEYNSNGDITKILEDNVAKMTYTYDSWHNVKTATTDVGVVYSFNYDEYGNNTMVSIGNGSTTISSEAYYTDQGKRLDYTVDALGKITRYGYDPHTNMLEWVQYPEDTADTRTEYEYDTMYRMAKAECTTDTGNSMSAQYAYTNDYLTSIQTPTTTYNFSYGDFGLRESVKVGTHALATYQYTDDANRYLQSLDYSNGDSVSYQYDSKGRLLTQTYEDGDTVSYAYDNNGALATMKDSATGRTTTYYYDLTDRMMKYVEKGTNYSHSVGYEYDTKNNLTRLVEEINGTKHTTSYGYDDDNRIETVATDGATVTYTYDTWGRVHTKVTKNSSGASVLTEEYTYVKPTINGVTAESTQIAQYKVISGSIVITYNYTYDDNGNILSINEGANTTSYVYDSANQLIRENNQAGGFTNTWEYDAGGNILNRKEYAYTTGSLEGVTPTKTATYGYEDDIWGDLLTMYRGNDIDYDEAGNMVYDGDVDYTWEHGRQLKSIGQGSSSWQFEYNADGMRTKRTYGTTTYSYVYNGSRLMQMTKGTDALNFTYDASGTPLTVKYNGTTYYYATNTQGDVVAILGSNGTPVVSYSYDAWGNPTSPTGEMKDTLGVLNPLRYRGYVYDLDTGLYYLQSRYYDPELGRFLNADAFTSTGQGFTGNNMFAYCGNNPVIRRDTEGTRHCAATSVSKENASDRSYSCYWQTQVVLEKRNPKPVGNYSGGNVYLVTDADDVYSNFPGDVVVLDLRGPGPNNGVEIRYSFLVSDENQQRQILTLLYNIEQANPTGWNRTVDSMAIEWDAHNDSHTILTYTPFDTLRERAAHVFLNNSEEGWSYWDHTAGRFLKGE